MPGLAQNGCAGPILQEHDTSEAMVPYHQTKANNMTTKHSKTERLILILGIALAAGGVALAAAYINLERRIHSTEAFMVTVDHLYQDQALSQVLKTLHEGNAGMAAQRLDLLLCDDILRLDAELASADAPQAAFVKAYFTRIARIRPSNPPPAAAATQELNNDEIEAEKVLARACGEILRANLPQRLKVSVPSADEANRHRLQLTKPLPLPTDVAPLAPATNQQLRLDQQKEPDTSICMLGPPILVAFTNAKRMVKQALTHATNLAPLLLSKHVLFGLTKSSR
jgi:hypothetical protein